MLLNTFIFILIYLPYKYVYINYINIIKNVYGYMVQSNTAKRRKLYLHICLTTK